MRWWIAGWAGTSSTPHPYPASTGAESLTLGAYVSSKFGVVGLSEQLRDELAPFGIGVSTLCPGHVATGLSRNVAKLKPVAEGVPLDENPAFQGLRGKRPTRSLSPDRLGAFVVRAIEENRAYIHPSPHYAELIEKRHREIMADFGEAADPSIVPPPDWHALA